MKPTVAPRHILLMAAAVGLTAAVIIGFYSLLTGSGITDSLQTAYDSLNERLRGYLNAMFKQEGTNYGLVALSLAFAVVAGGLHSLTPGHGKSVMAALLIGRRRSRLADVIIVASAITMTHTVVIFGIGFALLVLDATFSVSGLVSYFEKISAVIILLLASSLIWSGWKKLRNHRAHNRLHSHGTEHAHSHQHDESHDAGHSHGSGMGQHHHPGKEDFSAADSRLSLFAAGASGGIIPCIDALSLLLIAVSLGYVAFGLLLVFAFSLGLAVSIIVIGMILLAGKHKLKQDGRLATFAAVYAPLISGLIIFVVALSLLV